MSRVSGRARLTQRLHIQSDWGVRRDPLANPTLALVMHSPRKSSHSQPGASTGVYCLVLRLPRACRIAVAGRADCGFPPGWYVYVGSAKRNLPARLTRHLRRAKALHWHIDRLRPFAQISEIWVRPWAPGAECGTGGKLRRLPGARIPCRGFGASDCHCEAHLILLPYRPFPPGVGWTVPLRVRGGRLASIRGRQRPPAAVSRPTGLKSPSAEKGAATQSPDEI